MFEYGNVEIINSILHVLDSSHQGPLFSDFLIDNDDATSLDFALGSIEKILSSTEMKYAEFIDNNEIKTLSEKLSQNLKGFKSISEEIASHYFNLLSNNPAIESGDLLITLFEMSNTNYLCVTKHNYKSFITREIKNIRESNSISIIKNQSFLFSSKPKLDESFIINLDTLDIALIDKRYEINGEKASILEEYILNCKTALSDKEKVTIFNKVVANIESKYIDSMETKIDIKKAICNSFFEDDFVNVEKVIKDGFEDNKELIEIASTAFSKAGIKEVPIDEKIINKKYLYQNILTEEGIEIKIPVSLYNSKISFNENEDGSFNLSISNIKML